MAEPTVTVAVPLYKRRDYVGQALRSVAAQDHEALEILVSDNGENAAELRDWVTELLGGRAFRFRRNDRTVPLTDHFNQLIAEAQGEYFVLLSDDDEISPNYASTLAAALTADDEVAVAIARAELIDEAGNLRNGAGGTFPGGVKSAPEFIQIWCGHEYNFGSFVTNMARTEELRALGSYPDFVKGNSIDNALLIAATAGRKVALVEDAIFRYRIYEASTGLAVDYRELGRAQRQFLRYLNSHPALVAFARARPSEWAEMKGKIVEMAWRTYRHRWKHMYRDRLSKSEWARAAFQMPFIPAYYRAVVPHLVKSLLRGS